MLLDTIQAVVFNKKTVARSEPTEQLSPTEALLRIRKKAETGQSLSREEWRKLAHYVHEGAEASLENHISRESMIVILEAFQALLKLRTNPDSEWDSYFLGNLPWEFHADKNKYRTSGEVVCWTVTEIIWELKTNPASKWTPLVAARNLEVFLDSDEEITGIEQLNQALRPYWPVLWRVAARGHFFTKRKPVRDDSRRREYINHPPISSIAEGEYKLSFLRYEYNELQLLLSFAASSGPTWSLALGSYSRIAEFRAMLVNLQPRYTKLGDQLVQGGRWDGEHFAGYLVEQGNKHGYCVHADQSTFIFPKDDWELLQKLFRRAWEKPDVKLLWDDLSLEYGEL
jgi:hypothetical protein